MFDMPSTIKRQHLAAVEALAFAFFEDLPPSARDGLWFGAGFWNWHFLFAPQRTLYK